MEHLRLHASKHPQSGAGAAAAPTSAEVEEMRKREAELVSELEAMQQDFEELAREKEDSRAAAGAGAAFDALRRERDELLRSYNEAKHRENETMEKFVSAQLALVNATTELLSASDDLSFTSW